MLHQRDNLERELSHMIITHLGSLLEAQGRTFFGWGCAAESLEPLAYTRACSSEICYPILDKPAKTSFSPRSLPLGTFRAEKRLRLSNRNSMLMMQVNVYIINPVAMGCQI